MGSTLTLAEIRPCYPMPYWLVQEPSHRDRGALPKLIMEDMAQMNDFDLIALCKQYKVSPTCQCKQYRMSLVSL